MSLVTLAIYDLSQGMAAAMSQGILGTKIEAIYHTGIVVFNYEFFFGGGVQQQSILAFSQSTGLRPIQMLDLGLTTRSLSELQGYLRTINSRFTASTYNLLTNNCNNFSECIVQFLCNRGIPEHILNLPQTVLATPFGSMLFPMLENMQRNVAGSFSGSGGDPFGGGGGGTFATTSSSSFTSSSAPAPAPSLAALAVSSAPLPLPLVHAVRASFVPVVLEEKALLSIDASSVTVLGNKLLRLQSPKGGDELTEEEKGVITQVISKLGAKENLSAIVSEAALVVLFRVLSPPTHMSCCFLLRLLVLQPALPSHAASAFMERLVTLLANKAQMAQMNLSSPALVMSLCTLANWLGAVRTSGQPFDDFALTSFSADSTHQLVDVMMAHLYHERSEVRQISATLISNFCMLNIRDYNPSFWWSSSSSSSFKSPADEDRELHPHAVQIVCGILEDVAAEQNATTRRLRLEIGLRIVRTYKKTAVLLIKDLGFDDSLTSMLAQPAVGKARILDKEEGEERKIIQELIQGV